jgi:hypothetical protein
MTDSSSSSFPLVLGLAALVGVGALGWMLGSSSANHDLEDRREAATNPGATDGARSSASDKRPKLDKPNVIFVVLDTLRADHLTICGYDRAISPSFEHLASRGATYICNGVAPGSWTLPSHASFFTAKNPAEHRAHAITSGVSDWSGTQSRSRKLRTTDPMLAEQMVKRGYQTIAVSSNPVVSEKLGLLKGFEQTRVSSDWGKMFGDKYLPAVQKEMERARRDQPLFLFLNIADAHRPWDAIPEGHDLLPATEEVAYDKNDDDGNWQRYVEDRLDAEQEEALLTDVVNLYDAAVERADRNLGDVLNWLDDDGWCDSGCRIIVTSDHGEFLGEHGLLDHGHYVWKENINVPLLILDTNQEHPPLPDPINAIHAFHLVRDGKLPKKLQPAVSMAWPHVRRCARTDGASFCDVSSVIWDESEKVFFDEDAFWVVDATDDEADRVALPEGHRQERRITELSNQIIEEASDDNEEPEADVTELLKNLGYLD